MKDLIKGHNPYVLAAVVIVTAAVAAMFRNQAVNEGYSPFNANFLFILILFGGLCIYGILYEGLKELSKLLCRRGWKKLGITPQEQPSTSEPTAVVPEPVAEENPNAVTLDMGILSEQAHNELELERNSILRQALEYTSEVLGPYLSAEHMKILASRLSKFQRAGTSRWNVQSDDEPLMRIEPYSPITKLDLQHYGWNVGQLFDRTGSQIAFFLKTTFDIHFDKIADHILPKKLTIDPLKGIIKIDKHRFNAAYRDRIQKEADKEAAEIAKAEKEELRQQKFEAQASRRHKMEKRSQHTLSEDEADSAAYGSAMINPDDFNGFGDVAEFYD